MVADVVTHDDLVLFHAHGKHLFLRQGDGLVGSTDKTGDAADIPHQMPGVIRHDHFDKHITGEHLALDFFRLAGLADLFYGLHGDLHSQDHILHAPSVDEFLNAGLNGVFITGIGMDHIPLRVFRHCGTP